VLKFLENFSLIGKLVKNQRGPATVNESNLFNVTVLLLGWEDIGSDDHEPGNLPVFIAPSAYADRRVLSM
jgi:hypothetical protein